MLIYKILILACLAALCAPLNAQTTSTPEPAQTAPVSKPAETATQAPTAQPPVKKPASAPKQPAQAKPAVKPAAAKPAVTPKPVSIVEAELAGIFTNQLSDSLFARLRLERNTTDRLWFIRTAYTKTSTDSVSGNRIVTTTTSATKLDSEFRRSRDGHYDFLAAAYNVRGRNPANQTYPARSGYYLLYGGRGKPLGPKAEGGLGLGILHDYDDGRQTRPALVANVRGNLPLNKRISLDSRVLFIRPTGNGMKLDGDIAAQYLLMQGLYLRLGYSTTNLVRATRGTSDWNNAWRLSLLYRLTR